MDETIVMKALKALSDDAAEAIAKALIDDSEEEAALEILQTHGSPVFVANDGNNEVEYEEDEVESAEEAAKLYVEDGDWDEGNATTWVTVNVWKRWVLGSVSLDEEDPEAYTIEVSPTVPECPVRAEHEWVSPHAVVGGLKENPGVQGNGGGVIVQEVCSHCGCLKTTNTWVQNPETGEQGLTSVEYDAGNHDYFEAWEAWAAEEAEDE